MSKKRIVVKIGTNLIVKNGNVVDKPFLDRIARQAAAVIKQGCDLVIVSSGAIGAGSNELGFKKRPSLLAYKQAAAAVGQVILMEAYQDSFNSRGIKVAQVLLTREDLESRIRYNNARNTLDALLRLGVVPVINENDTVSVEEIEFGDNDTLSAVIAARLGAERLVILSDVEGFYAGDPKKVKNCKLISYVEKITPEIEKFVCRGPGSDFAVGGMAAKIKAAKIAVSSGVIMHIADGRRENVISDIVAGRQIGSCFLPSKKSLGAKKRWIAFLVKTKGKLFIDDGALKAIVQRNKSLLPGGVTGVEGHFNKHDVVSVCDRSGLEVARGAVYFSSDDIKKIMGKKSSQIGELLKTQNSREEVIHRDELAVLPAL